jgi:hypothetical protein
MYIGEYYTQLFEIALEDMSLLPADSYSCVKQRVIVSHKRQNKSRLYTVVAHRHVKGWNF